jgi:hypothetical protein
VKKYKNILKFDGDLRDDVVKTVTVSCCDKKIKINFLHCYKTLQTINDVYINNDILVVDVGTPNAVLNKSDMDFLNNLVRLYFEQFVDGLIDYRHHDGSIESPITSNTLTPDGDHVESLIGCVGLYDNLLNEKLPDGEKIIEEYDVAVKYDLLTQLLYYLPISDETRKKLGYYETLPVAKYENMDYVLYPIHNLIDALESKSSVFFENKINLKKFKIIYRLLHTAMSTYLRPSNIETKSKKSCLVAFNKAFKNKVFYKLNKINFANDLEKMLYITKIYEIGYSTNTKINLNKVMLSKPIKLVKEFNGCLQFTNEMKPYSFTSFIIYEPVELLHAVDGEIKFLVNVLGYVFLGGLYSSDKQIELTVTPKTCMKSIIKNKLFMEHVDKLVTTNL